MSGAFRPLTYLDARATDGVPHLVVDGAARSSTIGCLSHWPASPTPRPLWRDTSTEIALTYLEQPETWWTTVQAVTNDHLDEDGACGLYALVAPGEAASRASSLVALARAGDFEVGADERVAQQLGALRHLFDPARSVLAPSAELARDPMAWAAVAYGAALEILPEIIDHPGGFADWWQGDLDRWHAQAAYFSSGAVELRELPELDLVVVTSATEPPLQPVAFGHRVALALDPALVHARSGCARVLMHCGDLVAYYDRYETWVRYESTPHELRRDLRVFAAELGGLEPDATTWVADDPGALVAVCAPVGGRSGLSTTTILERLVIALSGPPAWDPFAANLGAVRVSGRAAPRAGTTGRGRVRWRGPRATAC